MDSISIQDKYIDFLLRNGHPPHSVYVFAADNGLTEAEFYASYTSFIAIENAAWQSMFDNAIERLHADETYAAYSVREKLLAFYYTYYEGLLAKRSFVTYTYNQCKLPKTPEPVSSLSKSFKKWASELISEGIEKGEIVQRPIISDKYVDGLWAQFLFLTHFWLKDSSPQFERADAAVEKSVNLSMDLMAHNTLDSAFDFAKFLIQKN